MDIVINIGELNSTGQFVRNRWAVILEWLAENCNNIRIYTKFHRDKVAECFSNGWEIEEESFPDPAADMRGFRLWGKEYKLWCILNNLSFDPDTGITHCYFLYNEDYIGEILVEDGENFIILHLTEIQKSQLVDRIPDLIENIEICNTWEEHINGMIGDEKWKPLGAV